MPRSSGGRAAAESSSTISARPAVAVAQRAPSTCEPSAWPMATLSSSWASTGPQPARRPPAPGAAPAPPRSRSSMRRSASSGATMACGLLRSGAQRQLLQRGATLSRPYSESSQSIRSMVRISRLAMVSRRWSRSERPVFRASVCTAIFTRAERVADLVAERGGEPGDLQRRRALEQRVEVVNPRLHSASGGRHSHPEPARRSTRSREGADVLDPARRAGRARRVHGPSQARRRAPPPAAFPAQAAGTRGGHRRRSPAKAPRPSGCGAGGSTQDRP